VPQDVAVVAICPDDVAERASPPLTSVLIPAEEVGREAVRLVMDKLAGKVVPMSTLLTPHLVLRAST
jgi:DNA-binding LacI/PurR family transcriptional regulator